MGSAHLLGPLPSPVLPMFWHIKDRRCWRCRYDRWLWQHQRRLHQGRHNWHGRGLHSSSGKQVTHVCCHRHCNARTNASLPVPIILKHSTNSSSCNVHVTAHNPPPHPPRHIAPGNAHLKGRHVLWPGLDRLRGQLDQRRGHKRQRRRLWWCHELGQQQRGCGGQAWRYLWPRLELLPAASGAAGTISRQQFCLHHAQHCAVCQVWHVADFSISQPAPAAAVHAVQPGLSMTAVSSKLGMPSWQLTWPGWAVAAAGAAALAAGAAPRPWPSA
jgi:hypothetical protein